MSVFHLESVWVVQAQCGDYYCGCGGGHILGVMDHAPQEGELDRYLGGKYQPDLMITEIPVGMIVNVSKGNDPYT